MTHEQQLWRHVAVQHTCLGNGCLGNGCLGNGCLGNGCLGNGCLGNGCLGNGCLGMHRPADGGGRARRRPVTLAKGPRTKFFQPTSRNTTSSTNQGILPRMKSLPLEIREIRATEARLQQIYDAARLGLKGDSLALASGMLPVEYRRLCQLDPIAEMAAQKGKADAEMAHAGKLSEASMNGDAKASLAILQHVHGWTAKQEISVDVYQKISVITALEEARARLTYVEDATPNIQLRG